MATMPVQIPVRQMDPATIHDWFLTHPRRAVPAREEAVGAEALADRPGLPWVWCGPVPRSADGHGRGLYLAPGSGSRWQGPVDCALPLPLPSEAFGAVVLQHVARPGGVRGAALLEEAARLLVNGGRLSLFVLNPLAL